MKITSKGDKIKYIICDLDGTIALIDHRRHLVTGEKKYFQKFNSLCIHDTPNIPVIELLKNMAFYGYVTIICSGRDETFRKDTVDWLKFNGVAYESLYMRPKNNSDPDNDLKRSWLYSKLPPKDQILFVLDDRQKVVDMWREEGLTCFQVAPGNF